jgi:hypothetical protein
MRSPLDARGLVFARTISRHRRSGIPISRTVARAGRPATPEAGRGPSRHARCFARFHRRAYGVLRRLSANLRVGEEQKQLKWRPSQAIANGWSLLFPRETLPLVLTALTACYSVSATRLPPTPVSEKASSRPMARTNVEDGLTIQLPNEGADYSPVTMDMRAAVSGVIGPKKRWIVAVPLDSGGSGGAFSIAIFGVRNHGIHLLQEVPTGNGGVHSLTIRNGVLIAKNARYLGHEANCCPAATNTLIFGDPHGYIELLRSWWNHVP